MDLSNELSCEAGSFSRCCNPHGFFFSQRFRGFMSLHRSPGWHSLSHSPVVPPGLSAHKCGTSHSTSHVSSPSQLPVSAPPTGLGECFFFNSLVVRLPHSLIFWQFWLFFFVFKFVVILLLVVSVSTYVSILAGSPTNPDF